MTARRVRKASGVKETLLTGICSQSGRVSEAHDQAAMTSKSNVAFAMLRGASVRGLFRVSGRTLTSLRARRSWPLSPIPWS